MALRRPCLTCGASIVPGEDCPRCHGRRRVPRACITCGAPARDGDYCERHRGDGEAARNERRVHYHGDYKRRAARLRARADADPTTRCAICGHTARRADPWTAHHLDPGNPDSDLAPAHRSCNSSLGNRVT